MKKKVWIILAVLLAGIVAGVVMFLVHSHSEKVKAYEEADKLLSQEDYGEAKEILDRLGNFEDAKEKSKYAQMEMDYRTLDTVLDSENYEEAVRILKARSDWYADAQEGKEAAALAKEYETVCQAFDAKKSGQYLEAAELFGSLELLKDTFAEEKCICKANHDLEQKDYYAVLLDLCEIKDTLQKDTEEKDFRTLTELLRENGFGENVKTKPLLEEASNGLLYEEAEELLKAGSYKKAMEGFLALQDYSDAPARYEEAKTTYESEKAYKKAVKNLDAEKYEEAMEAFEALGDYRDSRELYEKAKTKYEELEAAYKKASDYLAAEDYEKAIKAFQKLGSYRDSKTLYKQTKKKYEKLEKAYAGAVNDMNSENYEAAMKAFEALDGYRDSASLYTEAKNKFADQKIYQEAEAHIAKWEYYKARKLFLQIPKFKDAEARAEACRQAIPGNASLASGNGGGTSLTITAPSGSRYVYLKVYSSNGAAAGKIFLHPGGSGTISLVPGTYTIKVGYGTEWYGEVDMFGEDGSYTQLLNGSGSNVYFPLEANYSYTLQLISSTNGNVPSKSIGSGDM